MTVRNTEQIDLDFAKRQAFGGHFAEKRSDEAAFRRLLDRRELHLSPHSPWLLPRTPTWREDPFGDTNWTFQYHSLRWLDVLRRRAALGDVSGMRLWKEITEDWIVTNPPGCGYRWSWTDMSDAHRAMTLAFGLPYLPGDKSLVIEALAQHGEWLADKANLGRGNHALHQHAGLFVVGGVLQDRKLLDLAVDRLRAYVADNFRDDGVNIEGAVGYHRLNWGWTLDALERLKVEGFALPPEAARLDLTPEYLAHATRPDGYLEDLGDTEPVQIPEDPRYPQLQYVATRGSSGSPPDSLVFESDHGLIFVRSGWGETEKAFEDETFISISFGAQNKIHGHPDGGSFTFMSGGVPWVVDTGKYSYQANPTRSFVVSREGHNVTHVLGTRYGRAEPVELTAHSLDSEIGFAQLSDPNYQDVRLQRTLVWNASQEYLVIFDHVVSAEDTETMTLFNLGVGVGAERVARGYELTFKGDRRAAILFGGTMPTLSVAKGETSPVRGWVATAWKKADESIHISAARKGKRYRVSSAVLGHGRRTTDVPFRVLPGSPLQFEIVGSTETQRVSVQGDRAVVIARKTGASSDWVAIGDAQLSTASDQSTAEVLRLREEVSLGRQALVSLAPAATGDVLAEALQEVLAAVDPGDPDQGLRALLSDLRGRTEQQDRSRAGLWANRRDDNGAGVAGVPLINLPGWDSPLPTLDSPRVVTVNHGADIVPMLFHPGNRSGPLVVAFHGALNRAKYRLPAFQRRRSLEELGYPFLIIADHSLDRDPTLSLAWYLSGADKGYFESLANFVDNVHKAVSAPPLLVGSSGGGFAALKVAANLPHSQVLAFNPQVDLREYYPRFVEHAVRALALPSIEDPLFRVTNSDLAAHERDSIWFVRNRGDRHHWEHHVQPLTESAHAQGIFRVEEVDWGRGHKSPDSEEFKRLVRARVAGMSGLLK